MFSRITHFAPVRTCFAGLLLVVSTGWVLAQSPPGDSQGAPAEGVLVLYGGRVLQGRIAREGDFYGVVLPNGEIRVRGGEVAYVCASLDDAYRRRRADIRMDSADEHIELAGWCVRNRLLGAAAAELADAMASDPTNPMIPHIERQLEAARRPIPPPASPPQAARPRVASVKELEEMVRCMPRGSVESFTTAVQPLLLNSCTTGGCHGPRSADGFHLLRGAAGGPPSRRATQRNLQAVLGLIDRQRPETSPLLVEAIRAHGTAAEPALKERDAAKYRQIVQWVCGVAQTDQPDRRTPQTVSPRGPATARPMVAATVRGAPSPWQGASPGPSAGSAAMNPWPEPAAEGPDPKPAPPKVKRGDDAEPFVPVDPFDPEIFNRRYHGDGP
jgi:hypothetical protein